jgi:hypothetical protein
MKNILVDTEYSRNTGLGNKLFPWALAKIFSEQNNVKMVNQTWISIRGAAVTRGGIDYSKILRKIYLMDNFCNEQSNNEVGIANVLFKKKCLIDTLSEANNLKNLFEGVIVFSSRAEHNFFEMYGYQEFIKQKILAITKEKWKNLNIPEKFIGINIRSGNDFQSPGNILSQHRKTDMLWFVNSMNELRNRNIKIPALIISDGSEFILKNFANIDNVYYLSNKSAISDLLVLMNASILLGSGASSFSAWAAFLSQAPYFSSPVTPFDKYQIPTPTKNVFYMNVLD